MLLSIIVPVYNVEKYLERCVDSLLDQGDYDDYEIILVDDGSTDKSGDICDNYAKGYSRIHVIHKENGGLSSARNVGIKNASGKYVMFVDSDDYVKSFVLKKLMQVIVDNALDILSYNFTYVYGNGQIKSNTVVPSPENQVVTGDEYLKENLKNNTMLMTAWKNIYRLALIKEKGILFRAGYVHEDEEWTPRIMHAAKKVSYVNEIVYGYLIRSTSISNDNNRRAAIDMVENCKSLKDFSTTLTDTDLRCLIQNNIATLVLSAFYKGRLMDCSENISDLLAGLYVFDTNAKKIKLFFFNPQLYIFTNNCKKKIQSISGGLSSLKSFFNKLWDYISQKTRKKLRENLICKNQIRALKNHSFSIISSTCNGGVITSELREQFRTPTVNLWFEPEDYLKLASDLERYMSLDVQEVKYNLFPYPVGRIGDITVYFMHYHSFEEARNKWNERKKRINYDNLFFMMAEKDGCTAEDVKAFQNLPYKNKVIFTYNEYPNYDSAVCVRACSAKGEAAIMTDYVGLTGRKYDRYFDYVKWLNEGDIQ